LVHGFNNEMPAVLSAYWEIVTRMDEAVLAGAAAYGLILGFTWPGFASSLGFFPARSTAKRSGPHLLDLINFLRPATLSIDVQTHSLGARVALSALRTPRKTFIDNLLLSAPAVDHEILEPEQDFHASLESCNRCFVFHSKHDNVLKVAYRVGDIADGAGPALGLRGPRSKPVTLRDCANVHVVDCQARVPDHGGYRRAPQYFSYWKEIFSSRPLERYDEI
jgi:esterase/lipase superfamily enzyme